MVKSHAKINITLDVVGKREDGYHLLDMIMQSLEIHDEISLELMEEGIELTCNKPYVPRDEKNIAYKAVLKFLEATKIKTGVRLHIEKNIPVSAGMAGGSANAATVLRILNEKFNYPLSEEEMLSLGLSLGADVPFCMTGGTRRCQGIGEVITPLKDLKMEFVLLVKPPFGISTKSIFKKFSLDKAKRHPDTEAMIKAIERKDIKFIAENMKNLLENVTLTKHPVLRRIKEDMIKEGALGSMMTGSGPTVFGIFNDESKAKRALKYFSGRYKECYLTSTVSEI